MIPDWLVNEHAITRATWALVLATLLLVIATVVIWLDSLSKGREQRRRWEREDLLLAQSREPKYDFGLVRSTSAVTGDPYSNITAQASLRLWVANFGLYGLYIGRLFVKHRDHPVAVCEVNRMAPAGGQLDFEILGSFWEGIPSFDKPRGENYLYGDHEIWLQISDIGGTFETKRVLYWILYMQRRFAELRRGNYEARQPSCPKCGRLVNFTMPASGLLTEGEVESSGWSQALADLSSSCPNHSSPHLKSLGGPPDWFMKVVSGPQSEAATGPKEDLKAK